MVAGMLITTLLCLVILLLIMNPILERGNVFKAQK